MYIEQLIDSIEKRPKMYVKEEKIEYIYYYILGYCSTSYLFSADDIDKMFCNWFWKWLVMWIRDNIDSNYEPKSVIWYDDIKTISKNENEELSLFFTLSKKFFEEYKSNTDFFDWQKA